MGVLRFRYVGFASRKRVTQEISLSGQALVQSLTICLILVAYGQMVQSLYTPLGKHATFHSAYINWSYVTLEKDHIFLDAPVGWFYDENTYQIYLSSMYVVRSHLEERTLSFQENCFPVQSCNIKRAINQSNIIHGADTSHHEHQIHAKYSSI